jgi:hypothetical protein
MPTCNIPPPSKMPAAPNTAPSTGKPKVMADQIGVHLDKLNRNIIICLLIQHSNFNWKRKPQRVKSPLARTRPAAAAHLQHCGACGLVKFDLHLLLIWACSHLQVHKPQKSATSHAPSGILRTIRCVPDPEASTPTGVHPDM